MEVSPKEQCKKEKEKNTERNDEGNVLNFGQEMNIKTQKCKQTKVR